MYLRYFFFDTLKMRYDTFIDTEKKYRDTVSSDTFIDTTHPCSIVSSWKRAVNNTRLDENCKIKVYPEANKELKLHGVSINTIKLIFVIST